MKYIAIVKRPLITEKSMKLASDGKYLFEVGLNSTKGMIKNVVEEIFSVDVVAVKTLKNGAKEKRSMVDRKKSFRKGPIKKAIVQVKNGQKIDIFDVDKKGGGK